MKIFPLLRIFAPAFLAPLLLDAQTPVVPRAGATPLEWTVETAYAAKSDIAEGTRPLGTIDTFHARLSAVRTATIDADSAWLFGASWQRFDFAAAAGAPIPETLGSFALKAGYNRTLTPSWSLRAEIDPGIYSDFEDVSAGDFNAPAGLRFIYATRPDLQWFFGVNVDLRSGTPVIGGAGVRWKFAPDWTLLLLVPSPRIEYAVTQDLTFFASANLRGGTFRVARDFGRAHGRPSLDDQNIGYRELSAGVGARWKVDPAISLNAAAGWMFDRRFEFDDRDLLFNGDGAVAFQLSITGAF